MPRFEFYHSFPVAMLDEKHALKSGGDTLKAKLITSAADPLDDVWADVSADEVASSGGYTTGGVSLTFVSRDTDADGVTRWIYDSPDWTGSGGGFSFRTLVVMNDTAPSDELVGFIDFGRTITIASGESTETLGYTVFDQTDGLIVMGGSMG